MRRRRDGHLDDVRKKWLSRAFVGQAPMFFATSQKEVGDERLAPPRLPNAPPLLRSSRTNCDLLAEAIAIILLAELYYISPALSVTLYHSLCLRHR